MKSKKRAVTQKSYFKRRKIALAIATQFWALSVGATPAGGQIIGGGGTIEQHGSDTTIIQDTDRLAIDWQSFDVGKNERVEFVQPGQSAVALNRILGNKGSEILGRIDANGHVILVNPRGVVFGESATVNVGGLIASGLQINPQDFMNGEMAFKRVEGTDGTVINSGMINAAAGGNVALLGSRVENRGLISAKLGVVALASGREAVLTFDESGLLGVQVDEALLQEELGDSAAVINSGNIRAESGRVLLSANTTRDVFSSAVNWGEQKQARSVTYDEDGGFTLGAGGDVNNSGSINVSGKSSGTVIALASNIEHSGMIQADAEAGGAGKVELHSTDTTTLAEAGIVTANGEVGGEIKLLGKNVGLFDNAKVEAKGISDGGVVLVGGDKEGLNREIRNADFVFIGEAASIDVSSTKVGDGGRAIIFAEDTARINGTVFAKGGENGGDGGFVETSGKRGFEVQHSPDISAAKGSSGHWLIDPYNLTISSFRDSPEFQNPDEVPPFVSASTTSNLRVETLETALNNGGTVTIKTGDGEGDEGGQRGNITISSSISINPDDDVTLNLIAHNDIIIGANVQTFGSSSLNLHLNANVSTTEGSEGSISFTGTPTINTNGGDFKIGHINDDTINADQPGAYDISLNGLSINIDGGDFVAHAANRLTLGQDLNTRGGDLLLGATEWDFNNRRLNTTTDSSSNADGNITLITAGDLTLPAIQAAGDVTLRNHNLAEELTVTNPDNESGRVQLTGALILDLGVGSAELTNIRTAPQNTQDVAFATDIQVMSGENITLEVDNRIRLNDVVMTGDLRLDSESDIVQQQNTSVRIGGISTLLVDNQDVTLDGAANEFGTALYIGGSNNGSARNATIVSAGSVILGNADQTMALTGSLSVDAGADIQQNGALSIAGAATLVADNVIDLQHTNNEFSSLGIARAQTATVAYSDNLQLAAVQNVGQLDLSVQGNLTQTATLDADRLILDISGSTSLSLSENRIGNLSGTELSGGNVSATGPLQIGDLTINADTTINAAEIDVAGPVQLTGEADLIFNEVSSFTLSGGLQGVDAAANAVAVNGDNSDGTYTIFDAARWDAVEFAITGGDGSDSLQGPNLEATWSITDTDQHTLSTVEQGTLTFSQMERLSGGSQIDTFSFINATTTDLSLVGGEGNDVADYSAINDNITVFVGVDGGISGVELIRGNNTGTANFNSRLAARGDSENEWLVNAANAGEVALDGGPVMAFEGFNQLQGGDGEDRFILQADLLGGAAQVDGAAGNDIFAIETDIGADLFGSEGDDHFDLGAETLGGVSGGAGDDTYLFTANARVADLDGGTGLNTLQGFDSDLIWAIGPGAVPDGMVTVSVVGGDGTLYVQRAHNFTGLKGAEGSDTFLFSAANSGVGVDGGAGINTADFSLIEANHTVGLGALIESGISNVTEVVGNAAAGFVSTLEITGSGGGIWTFDAGDSGTVAHGSEEIQFRDFKEFLGGDGDDSFLISVSPAGPIDGRGGDDVFTLRTPALVATLNGGDGQDTLEAFQEVENNWLLSSPISVLQDATNTTVVQFSGMETLLGAENYADNFIILDGLEAQPAIVAGDGDAVDAIDYSRVENQSITVTLGGAGLTGFESVIGNGNHTLAGADEDSAWQLTLDGGSVSWGAQTTGFSGFGYWVGGSGDDSFNLQTLGPGAPLGIDGGGGSDELDLSALENEIHISLGDASGQLGLMNIEILSANSLYANRLTSGAAQADWTINDINAGTLVEDGASSLSFSGFHHLHGTQNNIFTLTGGGYLGGETAVGSITGNAENSVLRVTGDDGYSWLLDAGVGTGSLWHEGVQLLSYTDLTGLQGGQGADEFMLTDVGASIASIAGGAGLNSLRADFQRNGPLEWNIEDGVGGIEGMVGEFQQISRLHGQVGADVFNVGGATQLELIDSGAGGDEIRLAGNSHVDLILAGAGADTVAISDNASVADPIDGGDGNDTLDLTAYATAVIWNVVEQRIGSFDYLNIEDFRAPAGFANTFQAPDGNNKWTITGMDSGQLETDGQVVTYQAIANLLGGSMEDLFVLAAGGSVSGEIDGGAGNNTLQGDDAGNQWTLSELDAGDLGNRVGAFKRVGNLRGGSGNDLFNIEAEGALSGVLEGGAGSDSLASARPQQTWTLSGSSPGTIAESDGESFVAFSGVEALQGSGEDLLLGSELDTLWTIDGPGAGSLMVGEANVTFANFARVLGGDGNDHFTIIDDGALGGPVDGGGGINALVIERDGELAVSLDPERSVPGDNVIQVLRIHSIEAVNDDRNRLYGASGNAAGYNWIISGANTGTVSAADDEDSSIAFINFSRLLGGDRSDSFRVDTDGSLTGVDGGGGDDFLDYSAREDHLEITVGRLGEGTNFTIADIEGLVGNDDGSGTNNWSATLIASSGTNLWTLSEGDDAGQDGINDGVFEQEGGVRMVFRNFGHLRGGSGDDQFVLQGQGMLTGSIVDRGGNNNRLNLAGIENGRSLRAVLLAADAVVDGSADTLHIRGIQNVTGAGLATTLVGSSNANQWEINGVDLGQITYEGGTVRFNNVGHLLGGSAADAFTVGPAGRLSGWLGGGNGDDSIQFNTSQAVSVWLAAPTAAAGEPWWRLGADMETVTARSNPSNRLRLESAELALWALTGLDEGTVKGTEFRGFGRLDGGAGDDQFVFAAGGRLSGLVDGGAGDNSADLTDLTGAVTVSQGDRDGVDLRVANIQQIDANSTTSAENRLWGPDEPSRWTVTAPDAGNTSQGLTFTGFGNLIGGTNDDFFEFSADGTLSGMIDGGAHEMGDTVDYGSVTAALKIDLIEPVLYNVEELIGNGNTSLQGPNRLSQWDFTGGKDQGVLTYSADQRLSFSGINNVVGGDQMDTFRFSGGVLITNGVGGGDGADRFVIEPGAGPGQATWLAGGGGEDELEFIGGGNGWSATYGPNSNGAPVFSFMAPATETPSVSIGYSGMESVVVRSALDRMTLTGTAEADTYRLGTGSWQWDDLLPVFYRDALRSITVVGESDDTVAITGRVALANELRLNGGALVLESDEPIVARNLVLAGLHSAGSIDRPINTTIDELTLLDNLAEVHLRETDGLALRGVTGEEAVNLRLLNGDLRQVEIEDPETAINTVGALSMATERGSILLDRSDNFMGGVVSVAALTRAILHNASDTQLGAVTTGDFSLESVGDIHSEVAITAEGTTRLSSGGDIQLSAEENDLNDISAEATGNIHVVDRNSLVVSDIESESGNIVVVTDGAQGLGLLSAPQGEVQIDSGGVILDLNGDGTNIWAQRFLGRAVNGIGWTSDPLDLQVSSLDVVNQQNAVILSNTGPVTIERIHSSGDITLFNSTDVTFLKESVNAFHGTEDAQYPPIGEREMPSYGGDFVLNIGIGNIKTDGSVVLAQPHIAAKTVTILNPHGVFLPPSPVIYAPERIKITSGRSRNRPYWALDVVPNDIEDDTKYYGDVVGAGEQLIEVESLADIDPAIFTPVRNYVYQDVSIRLPSDQLYEDEEE